MTKWDTKTGKATTITAPLGSPPRVSKDRCNPRELSYLLSSDGRWQLWGAGETFTLVDRSMKKAVRCLSLMHRNYDPVVALSSDGRTILSCCPSDGDAASPARIEVWSATTGKRLMNVEIDNQEERRWPWFVALSQDGRRVAAAFGDKPAIRLWEIASGAEGMKFQTVRPVRSITWSPDGRFLVTGDEKGILTLWDVLAGQENHPFAGHRGEITALAFSADGLRLASGSSDTTALIWDMQCFTIPLQRVNAKPVPSLNGLWDALQKKEPAEAWHVLSLLTQNPDIAIHLLRERLRPDLEFNSKRQNVALLLTQLDDDHFQRRMQAMDQLEKMGDEIEPILQEALTKKPSPEVCQAINKMLQKRKVDSNNPNSLTMRQLQVCRGIEVLERIGTPAAQQVLEELSQLPVGLIQTEEATAALVRLKKPSVAKTP